MIRREFLASVTMALASTGTAKVIAGSESPVVGKQLTVNEVLTRILSETAPSPLPETVDTLKIGDPGQEVTGIATTFMATCEVIEAASQRGANLIITHEPIFYNHLDETAWLKGDQVLDRKQRLIREKGIAIFRFHDFWHRVTPDPVSAALVQDIGWSGETESKDPRICVIDPIPLRALGVQLKERLGLERVQAVGNPETTCRRIGVMPGASGGTSQIRLFRDEQIDSLIVGEISQWETNVYVRDANELGLERSLLVLGHVQSEEPGMRVLVDWLKPRFPDLPIFHVPTPEPFLYL